MSDQYFGGDTLDDVMHVVIDAILSRGDRVKPTKGWITELRGVMLEVKDARARLSRTETRGKPFGCLGELCWYLAGTNESEFITYYLPRYAEFAEGNVLYGAYGPRMFNWRNQGLNQLASVTTVLRRKRASRQAVIQLFDAVDIVDEHKDIPCTCTLQFMIRNEKLEMFVHMRSNDAFLGLPHDVFCFTMLQEIVARDLSVDLGPYKHTVASLHIYDERKDAARQFLGEGWQSRIAMPPMPAGNPWPAIELLRKAESVLRSRGALGGVDIDHLDPYWRDLIRLLQVFRCFKDATVDAGRVRSLRDQLSSDVYRLFIDERLRTL